MFDPKSALRLFAISLGALGVSGYLHGEPGTDLIDPTRPKGWQAPVLSASADQMPAAMALKLQGTFNLAGERSAVISGQRVVVGDEVSGARVLGIGNNKVILQVDGEEIELASLVPDVKSPSNGNGVRR